MERRWVKTLYIIVYLSLFFSKGDRTLTSGYYHNISIKTSAHKYVRLALWLNPSWKSSTIFPQGSLNQDSQVNYSWVTTGLLILGLRLISPATPTMLKFRWLLLPPKVQLPVITISSHIKKGTWHIRILLLWSSECLYVIWSCLLLAAKVSALPGNCWNKLENQKYCLIYFRDWEKKWLYQCTDLGRIHNSIYLYHLHCVLQSV